MRVGRDGDRAVAAIADDDRNTIGRRLDPNEMNEPPLNEATSSSR